MEEGSGKLHIVMLPWLAMGHLIPFFELSKRLALKGLRISFFSNPGNIRRLPPIPQSLAPLLEFVPCSLSAIKNLPHNIENTVDLHCEADRPLLHQAFAELEHPLAAFLADPLRAKPDWIIYDVVASSWVPALATRFGLSCALFSLFNAAVHSFFGLNPAINSPENLTNVPDRIPFPTAVAFRPFEARQIFPMLANRAASPSSPIQLMLIRTCREFEPMWLDLAVNVIGDRFPVVPVGFLPPSIDDEDESEAWMTIREWLDRREARSVIYAAFGTEARLTREQAGEVAAGLETSGLPFLWSLRVGSPPEGFEERVAGRGLVWRGWVPQARLLAHPAVGGFLTHCGWNSAVEGLAAGVAMAVLPMMFEQGLNARHLVESGYAVEVGRDAEDGNFSGEEIAQKLRVVMVEEEGEDVRMRARKGKEVFGSEVVQAEYIAELVKHLWKKKKKSYHVCHD